MTVGLANSATWVTTATSLRGQNGQPFAYLCPPNGAATSVWGTDVYTDDSSVCTAAVHAGLITFASGGPVVIEIRSGQPSYVGTARNGVVSSSYGGWSGSFVFVTAASPPQGRSYTTQPRGPGDQVLVVAYGKDETDGSDVGWNAGYPNPSFDDDPARRGLPNARWQGAHWWDGTQLCLSITNLEAPYPPAHTLAIGYTVTLQSGTFDDGSTTRTFVLYRYSGVPVQKEATQCFATKTAGVGTPAGLLETLIIPNDKPGKVTSQAVLEKDRWYLIEASGVVSDWSHVKEGVDAAWCYAEWRCGKQGEPWNQLRIDEKGLTELAGGTLIPSPDHVYRLRYKSQGKRLEVYSTDAQNSWSDNSGSFTVKIFQEGATAPITGRSFTAQPRAESPPPAPPTAPPGAVAWATTAADHRGQNGQRFTYACPAGGSPSRARGTDVYTDDSSICTAAVHAGRINPSIGGAVTIEIKPGQNSYMGTGRNGILSEGYGAWTGSFVFVGAGAPAEGRSYTAQPRQSGPGDSIRKEFGESLQKMFKP